VSATEALLCDVRKALFDLHQHLAETGAAGFSGVAYSSRFRLLYGELVTPPTTMGGNVPVLMAELAANLEAVAVALELPNDCDGTAEDSLLMVM
jgi:hypothetical protein